MNDMTLDLAGNGMLAVTRDALAALRNATMRDAGHAAAGWLQEAGYAGGASLFEAFRGWLERSGAGAPEALTLDEFQELAAEFFRQTGWGSLTVGSLHEAVATLDSPDWGEATPGAPLQSATFTPSRWSTIVFGSGGSSDESITNVSTSGSPAVAAGASISISIPSSS